MVGELRFIFCYLILLPKITLRWGICNSYTMGCPAVRGDNPRALALRTGGQTWYNYFIPPTSV